MGRAPNGAVIRQLEQLFRLGTTAGLDDGQLLDRFATRRDEGAFAALVERHGPMVLGVCRRVLRDPDDVEDAFQATFLILARRAGSIGRPNLLGNWLYGVARRVAQRARARSARRRGREQPDGSAADGAIARDPPPDAAERLDLRAVIDEELSRLPESQRRPIVLCHLEGLTHEEAAARLSWPVGTVRSRMARGRERLRVRLASRGVAPAALATAAAWPEMAPAAVPASLVDATVRAAISFAATSHLAAAGALSAGAAALARGAMSAMFLSKLKLAAAVGLVSVGLSGGGAALVAQPDRPGGGTGATATRSAETPLDALIERRDALEAEMERLRDQQTVLIDEIMVIERELEARRDGPTTETAPAPESEWTTETIRPNAPAIPPANAPILQGRVETYDPPNRLVFLPENAELFSINPGDEVFVYQPRWETMTLMGSEGKPAVAMKRPDHVIVARARIDAVEAGKALCTIMDVYNANEDIRNELEVVRISDLTAYREGPFLIPDMASIPASPGSEEVPPAEPIPSSAGPTASVDARTTPERPDSSEPLRNLAERLDALEAQFQAFRQPLNPPPFSGGVEGGFGGGVSDMGGMGGFDGFGSGMGGPMRGGDQTGQIPYVQGESVIVVQPEGQDRIFAYSLAKGQWYPQDLPESRRSERVTPIVGGSLAALSAGEYVLAFSGAAGRWGTIRLDAEGVQPILDRQAVMVEHAGKLHVFSGETGTWSTLDLKAPGADGLSPDALIVEGNRISIQDPHRESKATLEIPGASKITPIVGVGVVAPAIRGENVTRIAAYSNETGQWHEQELREPTRVADPIVGHLTATYQIGRTLYVFSARSDEKWRVFGLESGQPAPAVGTERIAIRQGDELHVLNVQFGEWKTMDIAKP